MTQLKLLLAYVSIVYNHILMRRELIIQSINCQPKRLEPITIYFNQSNKAENALSEKFVVKFSSSRQLQLFCPFFIFCASEAASFSALPGTCFYLLVPKKIFFIRNPGITF